MNREIKFRGKELINNEWVYGFYMQGSYIDTDANKTKVRHLISGAFLFDVNPETIGQYTGLHDKNGKEIYEGDIVVLPHQDIAFGIVTWHDNGYFFIDNSNGEWRNYGNDFRTLGEFMNLSNDHKIKVIGNIHDNFDLMK